MSFMLRFDELLSKVIKRMNLNKKNKTEVCENDV